VFFISKTNLAALYTSLGLDRTTYSFALQMAFINIAFIALYPLLVLIPMLFWGGVQEMVYRGLLQNQLSKKIGPTKAILISNLLFTFGPLHFHHYQYVADNIAHIKYFAFIFVMGLFFAWVYKRYNNLWLAGLFHGIGNVYLDSINTAKALFM
jgi:membrane protease YdiL (CAAX protease family)